MTNTEINVLEKELDFASIQNKINELERKKVFWIFLFCLDLALLMKMCVETRVFFNFANNSRSKQNKKSRTPCRGDW